MSKTFIKSVLDVFRGQIFSEIQGIDDAMSENNKVTLQLNDNTKMFEQV